MASSVFANIALDIEAPELRDRLFTYGVPDLLQDQVSVGSCVLVPFGKQGQNVVSGYVVSLEDSTKKDFKVKDVFEVIDKNPFFDSDYIDFLHWLANTYCANLADVIAAALPSSISPRLKRRVRLVASCLRTSTDNGSSFKSLPEGEHLFSILAQSGESSMLALKRRYQSSTKGSASSFYKALNWLKQRGNVEVLAETNAKMVAKSVDFVEIALEPQESTKKLISARHQSILEILSTRGGKLPLKELVKLASTTSNTIKKMIEAGLLSISKVDSIRDPLQSFVFKENSVSHEKQLTAHQTKCLSVLENELEKILDPENKNSEQQRKIKPWLLFGVTGSGKTEVYLRLIEKTIKNGKTALIMVPEIGLTSQLVSHLNERFPEMVSIWHSAVSAGERFDTWRRIRDGSVKILLGARSAVLANIPNLGLIILDEEHDSSYKQTSPSPRYNAKDVALEKARHHNALVLFGSATPDLSTYHRALLSNQILTLPERVFSQTMPTVNVVDMKEEMRLGNRTIFSKDLFYAIEDRLKRKEQVVLLVNRRGYASHVFCRACGYVATCKHCSVSMVFHRFARQNSNQKSDHANRGFLSCHHCGYERANFKLCPNPECQSPFIKEYGLGTQKVEEQVHECFPDARVVRLDSDVTLKKGAFRNTLEMFKKHEADILIGTQMVAKGLDIANVTLVGVLAADAALNMPDYRSTERGYQLLSQVAGRAGRGERPGEVFFQSYNNELEVFQAVKDHDFESFAQNELASRKTFNYPPFGRIIRIVFSSSDQNECIEKCEHLVKDIACKLRLKIQENEFEVLGPAPCLVERIKGKFRYHLIVKIFSEHENAFAYLVEYLRTKTIGNVDRSVHIAVDVDAIDLI